MTKLAILLLLSSTTACIGSLDDVDEDDDEFTDDGDVAAVEASLSQPYSPKGDPSPSSDFNRPGKHNDQCSRLAAATVALRYPNGTPTGYSLKKSELGFDRTVRDDRDGNSTPGHVCGNSEVQLDAQEIVKATFDGAERRLLFHRGGNGYAAGAQIKYGYVALADLADHVDIDLESAGNGKACTASQNPATDQSYAITPRSIPAGMNFRKSNYAECVAKEANDNVCANGFSSYGDPGFDQGNFAPADRHHYTYLLWSFTNIAGGGAVRSVLPENATFHRCNVRAIKQKAYSANGRREIGWVKSVYGKVRLSGGDWQYGWITHSDFCDPAQPECAADPGKHNHVRAL